MMTDRLEEIRERAEAATPGPWTVEPLVRKYYGTEILDGNARLLFTIWRDSESEPSTREIERAGLDGDFEWSHMESADDYADATFTAHARQDIPYLLAEVERLRGAVADTRDMLRIVHWRATDPELSHRMRLDLVDQHLRILIAALCEGGES